MPTSSVGAVSLEPAVLQSCPTGHGNKELQSRSRGAGAAPLGGREGGRAGELLAGADGKDELQARRVRAEERQKGFSFRTLFGTVVKHRLIQIHSAITLVHERQSGRNNN